MSPAVMHLVIKDRHSKTHRLILLPMDVEDVTLFDSPGVWVHEERLPIDHILQTGMDATVSANIDRVVFT